MKEALKLALEWAESHGEIVFAGGGMGAVTGMNAWAVAVKEALAPLPEQEPVAWMVYTQEGQSVYVTDNPTDLQESQRALPLYTTPPKRPWVGLTDEDIYAVLGNLQDMYNRPPKEDSRIVFAQAIDVKLKEKNAP